MTDSARTGPVAAVDCGTNSTRLLIADRRGRALVRQMEITRLGAGVDATHLLAAESIDRTIRVLSAMKKEMDSAGVGRGRLVATSAVRDADNGQEFLTAASEVMGLPAELLSGDEEGRLSYAGATADLSPTAGDDVVMDIGGGSTELVVGRAGDVQAISLDLGCVRVSERHFAHDPPLAAEIDAAVVDIHVELDRAVLAIPKLEALAAGSRLLGLAGTVSTLTMLDQQLGLYDRDRVHHAVLSRSAVARWCSILAAEPSVARGERPGMVSGREDVIVGGALVFREVMTRFGFETCLVSESDILDGLVASQLD